MPYYLKDIFVFRFIYWLFDLLIPEDFWNPDGPLPRNCNPVKTEALMLNLFFAVYIAFMVFVIYMTNRKRPLPEWYPKWMSFKKDNQEIRKFYIYIIGSVPFVIWLLMWIASICRRILMWAGCW